MTIVAAITPTAAITQAIAASEDTSVAAEGGADADRQRGIDERRPEQVTECECRGASPQGGQIDDELGQ